METHFVLNYPDISQLVVAIWTVLEFGPHFSMATWALILDGHLMVINIIKRLLIAISFSPLQDFPNAYCGKRMVEA